jgi:uncharacterized protein
MSDRDPLGLLLLDRSFERAHYGFVLAAGAAAIGRPVVLFATNGALHALCRDWNGLLDAERDEVLRSRGVAGLDTLRDAVLALEVPLLACEAGLRGEAIPAEALLPAVQVSGVPGFLHAVGRGQVIAL